MEKTEPFLMLSCIGTFFGLVMTFRIVYANFGVRDAILMALSILLIIGLFYEFKTTVALAYLTVLIAFIVRTIILCTDFRKEDGYYGEKEYRKKQKGKIMWAVVALIVILIIGVALYKYQILTVTV